MHSRFARRYCRHLFVSKVDASLARRAWCVVPRRRLCRGLLLQITRKGVKQKLFVLDAECNLPGE